MGLRPTEKPPTMAYKSLLAARASVFKSNSLSKDGQNECEVGTYPCLSQTGLSSTSHLRRGESHATYSGTSGTKLETSSGALAAIVANRRVVLLKGNPNTFGSNPNVKFVLSYKDLCEFSE